jgi:hypothetical protein
VDEELEKKNFEAAGDTPANLWNDLEIDENPVKAEYIVEPAGEEIVRFEVTPSFRSRHVFESQYMTVYMKCDDRTCYSAFRTSVYRFFPHRRMPTLIPISNTSAGLVAMDLEPDMYKKPIKFLSLAQRVVMEEALAPITWCQNMAKISHMMPISLLARTKLKVALARYATNITQLRRALECTIRSAKDQRIERLTKRGSV